MRFAQSLAAATALAFLQSAAAVAAHDGVHVSDAYARVMPGAQSGAVFMVIENHADAEDRLIGAVSRIADRAELHTHIIDETGLAQMREVPDGFVIPPLGSIELKRGGDHVMLMGIIEAPAEGGTVPLTLIFERSGEITLDVPVDNARKAGDGMGHGAENGAGHGAGHGHGTGG
jgi:hypothetical protein